MSKYLRTRHVPFNKPDYSAVQEGIDDFAVEILEAGQLLRHCREGQGWDIFELGEHVGADGEHILMIENGETPISIIEAKKFGRLFQIDYHLFL